jgi:hypothetical protein
MELRAEELVLVGVVPLPLPELPELVDPEPVAWALTEVL